MAISIRAAAIPVKGIFCLRVSEFDFLKLNILKQRLQGSRNPNKRRQITIRKYVDDSFFSSLNANHLHLILLTISIPGFCQ
jgi:hypothetical protein